MTEIAPWLVVGGAALVVVCAAVVLADLHGALRRRRVAGAPGDARSALERAGAGDGVDEETLLPLLLRAVTEATGADAAVVTLLRDGHRRSFSSGLPAREARGAVDELVSLALSEPRQRDASVVVPVEQGGTTGAVAAYWRDAAPREVDAGELAELAAIAFPALPPAAAGRRPAAAGAARADERERWSRLADLNATLEPALLLQKIVDATLAECGAAAAAARLGGAGEQDPVSEVRQFAEQERSWVESVLASETLLPSITRYLAPRGEEVTGGESSIATAIVVPLRGPDAEPVGNLVAVWRRDLADEGDAKVAELEALVADAAAALGNASRVLRLQSLAVRDPSTGLFDQRHFRGLLAGAVETARRTWEPLSLLLFAAFEIEPAAHELAVASLEQALVEGSAGIARVVGERGVTCRVGLGEFAVILANTDLARARLLLDALGDELPAEAAGEARLTWAASAVQLAEREGEDELWQRARRELQPGRAAAVRTTATAPVVSGAMRLSRAGGDDWTLRRRPPGGEAPGAGA
jgi:GGDEF domain-containing protein